MYMRERLAKQEESIIIGVPHLYFFANIEIFTAMIMKQQF